ncbi:MAG: virulence RhuM family protein [Spirochaetales bacterium]|nr:virulence RhuM family protein [Spirochaetales bacterium]
MNTEKISVSDILIFQQDNGNIKIDVHLEDDTVWLTQKLIAKLFQVKPQNITMHLKNIYEEGELDENATCKDFLQVQIEGNREVKRNQKFYNLDAIISVGYRIKSHIATQFRIWATGILKEYLIKGFTLNDDRFKNGNSMNYFNELQERIREIRLSEKFFYQKIKDIYTTSIDYDSENKETMLFFKKIQNKLLWAISQKTAAELVYSRVDASLPVLGMKSYDKEISKKVSKGDVSIAKNYLNEDEIQLLGLLVEQYLAFAETMAQQHTPMYMKDWTDRLDIILKLNGRELLTHAGEISHKKALDKSGNEYDKYWEEQKNIQRKESFKELEADIQRLGKEVR